MDPSQNRLASTAYFAIVSSFVLGDICTGGLFTGDLLSGGFCPGGFCPRGFLSGAFDRLPSPPIEVEM